MGTDHRYQEIFVGRRAELAVLGRRIDATASGRGGVVLVAGEPGIGKTRLAEEAAEYAKGKGIRVLWGRCWEGAGAPAFWPWLQIVRAFARGATLGSSQLGLGDETTEVASIIPELDEVLRSLGLSPVSTDSDQDRFRFFDRILGVLTKVAAAQPLFLVLDDLHWADHGSLLLLQFLSAEIVQSAISVVCTYRDVHERSEEPIAQVLAAVSRQRHSDVLVLFGLEEPDVRELLRFTAGSELSARLLAAVMERTEGNPFFLTEVMTIVGTRNLCESNGSEIRGTVPRTVREVIRKHLCSVSADCASILDVASVVGREFDLELIANATKRSPEEICQVLDEAVSRKIIEIVRFTSYRFRHALVRETIYESLSTTERARTHLMVGEALKDFGNPRHPSTLSMLAHHFSMSLPFGAAAEALDYSVRAGLDARRRLGYEDAVAYFERALELDRVNIRPAFHCDLLLWLGEAQMRSGLWRESRQTFQKAACEARLISSWNHLALAAIGIQGLLGSSLPIDDSAVALLRESLARLGDADNGLRIRVLGALSHALYLGDAEKEIEQHSRCAVQIAERIGDQGLRRLAVEAKIFSLWRPTYLSERMIAVSELVNLSEEAEDKEMAFRGHFLRHACLLETGIPVESRDELERANALAEETRNSRARWQIALIRSARALAAGNLGESIRLTELAREVGQRVHDSSPEHYFLVQRFQYGRVTGALRELKEPVSAAVTQYPGVPGYRVAQAAICAGIGEARLAHAILSVLAVSNFAEIRCDALFLWTLGVLTEASLGCGEREWWQALYDLLLPFREHNIVMSWGVAFDGSVAHFLGILCAALGEFARGAEHFNAALAMNTKMGAEPLVARTQEQYAALLLERRGSGDDELARDLLHRATETMARVGQVGHLARAQQLLARLDENRSLPPADVRVDREGDAGAEAGDPSRVRREVSENPYLFRREADFWTVAFEGAVLRLRHTRGLAVLSLLLRQPETEVHVFDLMSAVNGMGVAPATTAAGLPSYARGALPCDAGPLLDARARTEYRRRVHELRDELAEAEGFNDLGRVSTLRSELAQLAEELQRAYGKAGRPRVADSAVERARISVRNNIAYTLRTLKQSDPALWRHMKAAVRTGTFCCYQPERTIPWAF